MSTVGEESDKKPVDHFGDLLPGEKLMDATKTARALGLSPWSLGGIKKAGQAWGDSPFIGRYTTPRWVVRWMKAHPEFSASAQHRRRAVWPSKSSGRQG